MIAVFKRGIRKTSCIIKSACSLKIIPPNKNPLSFEYATSLVKNIWYLRCYIFIFIPTSAEITTNSVNSLAVTVPVRRLLFTPNKANSCILILISRISWVGLLLWSNGPWNFTTIFHKSMCCIDFPRQKEAFYQNPFLSMKNLHHSVINVDVPTPSIPSFTVTSTARF